VSFGNEKDSDGSIIRMREPPDELASIRARFQAAGIPPDLIAVTSVQPDGKGGTTIGVSIDGRIADKVVRALTIKLHEPERPEKVSVSFEEAPPPAEKSWTGKEHAKLAKAMKRGNPDRSA